MNLLKYNYPTGSEVVVDPQLLAEAKKRGYYKNTKPFTRIFWGIAFFLEEPVMKASATTEAHMNIWLYCRRLLRSWKPKHEEKEAVCTMLMSEILATEHEEKFRFFYWLKFKLGFGN